MSLRVMVIGSGIAGTAAALTARALGAEVTVVRGRPGASSLAHGALDDAGDLGDDARAVLDALGGYSLGPCTLAASTGVLRKAAGRDASLLDLTERKRVLVPAAPRAGWDGTYLARAWSGFGPTFFAVDVPILKRIEHSAMVDAAIASLFDDEAYLRSVAEALRAVRGDADAILMPPWLGASVPRARDLSLAVGIDCGEAMGDVGGPAGLRFEAARDRALAKAGIETVAGWASAVERSADIWEIDIDGAKTPTDRVVLAIGGLVGGGIRYAPAEAALATVAPSPRLPFELSMSAPVVLGDARPLVLAGSIFGTNPERLAWPFVEEPLLERIGIIADPDLHAHDDGLFAAGDAIAERPRKWLDALITGCRAGRSAATS